MTGAPGPCGDAVELWREGLHDDLVLAVGLAAWMGEKTLPPVVDEVHDEKVTVLVPW